MDIDPKEMAKEVIRQVSTPGDAAALLLGIAVGAPIDYLLLHLLIPPGYCILTTTTLALFLKKNFSSVFGGGEGEIEKFVALLESHKDLELLAEFHGIQEAWKAGFRGKKVKRRIRALKSKIREKYDL